MYHDHHQYCIIQGSTTSPVVLCSKLADRRCEVQFPVTFVDLAVERFPWFTPKLVSIRARIRQKDLHLGHCPRRPKFLMRAIGINPTTYYNNPYTSFRHVKGKT